eukprot:6631126-Pyramimonas_sp.AAC.1
MAEYEAAIWAAAWLIRYLSSSPTSPMVSMHTDNMQVVNSAALGATKGQLSDLKKTLDGLVQVLTRTCTRFYWDHTPGHSDHPWNEMADT